MKNDYLEYRLQEWARWFAKNNDGLGFPSKNILAVMMEYGGSAPRGFGLKLPPSNSSAEEVEDWVRKLHENYPSYADALRTHYFNQHKSLKLIAKEKNVSFSTIRERIHNAKLWLNGYVCRRENSACSAGHFM